MKIQGHLQVSPAPSNDSRRKMRRVEKSVFLDCEEFCVRVSCGCIAPCLWATDLVFLSYGFWDWRARIERLMQTDVILLPEPVVVMTIWAYAVVVNHSASRTGAP